jgi:hypothetical protein
VVVKEQWFADLLVDVVNINGCAKLRISALYLT